MGEHAVSLLPANRNLRNDPGIRDGEIPLRRADYRALRARGESASYCKTDEQPNYGKKLSYLNALHDFITIF